MHLLGPQLHSIFFSSSRLAMGQVLNSEIGTLKFSLGMLFGDFGTYRYTHFHLAVRWNLTSAII